MVESIIERAEIRVACPGCGHEVKKQIGWVRTRDEMPCEACGQRIPLDDQEFRAMLERVYDTFAIFRGRLSGER